MRGRFTHALATEREGFTLVELLAVIAIVAVLIGVLMPALASVRKAAGEAQSRSNLRQILVMSRVYANEHEGYSPALGVPWGRAPFWAIVVQEYAGVEKAENRSEYEWDSILRSPIADAFYGRAMERCFAINATGHAGLEGDPDNFDEGPAHIRVDGVERPSEVAYFIESGLGVAVSDGPPPARTVAVLDFRQADHVATRVGWWGREWFNAGMFDGSVGREGGVRVVWREALP